MAVTADPPQQPAGAPEGGAAGPPPARPLGRDEAYIALAVACNVLVAVLFPYFPFQDPPNHVARYVLLSESWTGAGVAWVDARLLPTGYIGLDLLGMTLVQAIGVGATAKLLAVMPLLLLPAGFHRFRRVATSASPIWTLVAVLLSFSWFYMYGALSFCLGLGAAFLWLTAWWPHRVRASPGRWLALLIGSVVLYLVHLSALLIVLVVLGLDAVAAAAASRAPSSPRAQGLPTKAGMAIAVGLVFATCFGLTAAADSGGAATPEPAVFRTIGNKLLALAAPFYALSLPQFAVTGGAYAAFAVLYFWTHRTARGVRPVLALASLAFLVLYALFPKRLAGAGDVDVRWLMPAYLFPFCALVREQRPSSAIRALLLAVCLANTVVFGAYAFRINADLSDYDQALAQLPRASRLLPIVADQQRYQRVSPYLHHALWHTAHGGGRVAGIFSGSGTRQTDATNGHLSHFRVRNHLYYPPADWGVGLFSPLDCEAIRRDYDYILQAGRDGRAAAQISRCGTTAFRVGEFTVYRAGP